MPVDADIRELPDGSLRIGAGASLAAISAHPLIRASFAALASACAEPDDATPSGDVTLGADLSQRGRCKYLQQGDACLKNGGDRCLAIDGDNRYLAIVEGGPSWLVHPSHAGVALVALEATIEIATSGSSRVVPAADFFVLPTVRLDSETVLSHDEMVQAVHLPAESSGGVQRFTASREENSGVVLASVAATRRRDGDVRLVVGRVSPRPYRVYNSIEEETTTGGLDDDTIEGLAQRAMLDAEPLSQNGEKLAVAEGLLRDAIRALSSERDA